MNRDSFRLALTGVLIGALALSATVTARLIPPARVEDGPEAALRAESAPEDEAVPAMATEAPPTEAALTEAAPTENAETAPAPDTEAETAAGEADDPTAGPFRVALQIPDPIPGERLFLCDALGCPLEEVTADREGDAVLGPLAPGRYGLWRGETEAGSFRLKRNAALADAAGRLWTDGEVLRLERFVPGTVRLYCTVEDPGYYTLLLCDRDGRTRRGDLYVSDSAAPNEDGRWERTVEFGGLAPGLYTAVRRNTPLGQVEVRAAEIAELRLRIEN